MKLKTMAIALALFVTGLVFSRETCCTCNGSGYVDAECPECSGSGVVMERRKLNYRNGVCKVNIHKKGVGTITKIFYADQDDPDKYAERPCPKCFKGMRTIDAEGTGKVRVKCPECKGTGSIAEETIHSLQGFGRPGEEFIPNPISDVVLIELTPQDWEKVKAVVDRKGSVYFKKSKVRIVITQTVKKGETK